MNRGAGGLRGRCKAGARMTLRAVRTIRAPQIAQGDPHKDPNGTKKVEKARGVGCARPERSYEPSAKCEPPTGSTIAFIIVRALRLKEGDCTANGSLFDCLTSPVIMWSKMVRPAPFALPQRASSCSSRHWLHEKKHLTVGKTLVDPFAR